MSDIIFKLSNPLTISTSTIILTDNDLTFDTKDFDGLYESDVKFSLPQEIETTSNPTFNAITSSNTIKIGTDSLFLGDGFISSSNSVVAHTGSIVVTSNVTAPSMTTNGQLDYGSFEVSVTGSTTLFDSGSSRFGDTLDDTHIISGSTSISGSFGLKGTSVSEISNDTALADGSSTSLATENATKQYFIDTGIAAKNTYLRKSFVHTGSFTSTETSSFTAVTASAPTELSATTEEDFMFFINGMLIENDALTIVQKTSTNLELRLDTSGLGYELESDDEVIGFGKFNS